jgi:hypothetical protein
MELFHRPNDINMKEVIKTEVKKMRRMKKPTNFSFPFPHPLFHQDTKLTKTRRELKVEKEEQKEHEWQRKYHVYIRYLRPRRYTHQTRGDEKGALKGRENNKSQNANSEMRVSPPPSIQPTTRQP